MHAVLSPTPTTSERPRPATPPARTKMLVAGIAVASAGVLATSPVTPVPTASEAARAAVELTAVTNPLVTLQTTFANTFANLASLNANGTTSANALAAALGNPAVQAQFTGILSAATDPTRLLGTITSLPGYLQRLAAAQAASGAQFQEAVALLPGVLQASAGFLAQGKFLEAFAEVNFFFLTAGLSDLRGSALDALRVPGDILDSLGLEPLARILGTSWMDQGTAGPGFGRGLLSRAIVGNFGRAVLGAPITAVFQTVEIMDAVRAALQTGDLATAVSELVNAPIKIVNAFVNGYVPAFVTDPNSPIPPGPGQSFPGLIGPTGTFDFLFRQIPAEIAAALQVPRPAAPPAITTTVGPSPAARTIASTASPSDIPAVDATTLPPLNPPAPAASTAVSTAVSTAASTGVVVPTAPVIEPVTTTTAPDAPESSAPQTISTAPEPTDTGAEDDSAVDATSSRPTSNRPTSSRPTSSRPTSSPNSSTPGGSATGTTSGNTTSGGSAAGSSDSGGNTSGGDTSGSSDSGSGGSESGGGSTD